MLTEKPDAAAPAADVAAATAVHHAPKPGDLDDLVCYFEGEFVPMRDAKVSIMTHAFMYGTATFEGIRAYWNADEGRLYGLKIREHAARLRQSCRILMMENVPSVDDLSGLIVETIRRNDFREDAYIRPSFYKSTRAIGVRLHHLENELYIVAVPFGNYIDTDSGTRVMTSSWRRNADEALPARGKIVGGYVNMAFQKSEAELNGFDEAIVLTADGHVNEASAANIFVVRDGVALTPPVTDDILEGVTRLAIIELLGKEGIPVEIRSIDRSELYVADEMFLCGTGVQVSSVIEVDHRPVGTGTIGPIGQLVRDRYFDAVRGRLPEYAHWLTPID
jgi:branched-chain amino acid aminotransferase